MRCQGRASLALAFASFCSCCSNHRGDSLEHRLSQWNVQRHILHRSVEIRGGDGEGTDRRNFYHSQGPDNGHEHHLEKGGTRAWGKEMEGLGDPDHIPKERVEVLNIGGSHQV